ncbi:related to 60S ribosomal protein L17-B [Zygosaccharomyces bailii ISA1307]|nr:related to 60S ribosomal protein L17-B [Zygosaccharomyces bailii ISA1307]
MARYGATSTNPAKSASARASYMRVSFKNTRETAQAVNGWELKKAQQYLSQVLEHQRAIPFRRYNGSIGRASQGKEFGVTKARWPAKSVKHLQSLIQNAEANAEAKGLDGTKLYISHIQVNRAPKRWLDTVLPLLTQLSPPVRVPLTCVSLSRTPERPHRLSTVGS